MADWSTIASLATAGGTLVLALATFASVRSARLSTQVTERALLAGIRPVLVPTRLTDQAEKVGFIDNHWLKVEGQLASIDVTPEAIYMSFTLRNVGAGIGVLDRWDLILGEIGAQSVHRDPDEFTRLSRDLYIPAGDMGFWQGAFRDPSDPRFIEVRTAIEERQAIRIDLLYEDHEGGQRTISRFSLTPVAEDRWLTSVARHWNLDRDDPR